MDKNLKFSDDELKELTDKVIELRDTGTGIELQYENDLLRITKENKPYKLSNEELIALKIFLDTLSISVDTLRNKIK